MALKPDCASESPEAWVKPTLLGPTQSGGLGWNPRISISDKFPGDAAGPGPTLRKTDTEKIVQEDDCVGEARSTDRLQLVAAAWKAEGLSRVAGREWDLTEGSY